MAHFSMGDLVVTGAVAVLGLFMKRYGWPRPPILIAVALGTILEKYMMISLAAYGFEMLLRPAFLVVSALLILVILWGVRIQKRAQSVRKVARDELEAKAEEAATGEGGSAKDMIIAGVRRRLSVEFVGEIILLLFTGLFFIYLFVDTLGMAREAKLLPLLAVGLGTPFWLLRAGTLLKWGEVLPPREIMDTGFLTGDDPKTEVLGFIRMALFIAGLYLGIWVFGFHIAVPVGILIYLLTCSEAGWFWSLFAGLAFAALIVGVFDWTLNVPWHEPLLGQFYP